MPSLDEITHALTGSVELIRGDAAALGRFNMSVEGFWRSFAAIILVAPIYLTISGLSPEVAESDVAPAPVRLIVLAVEWVAFPLAMVFVARLLGLQQRYAGYIIVYNWSSVPAMAALVPPFLLHGMGLIGAQSLFSLFVALSLGVAYYRWLIARITLEVGGGVAAGIVVFDFAVSLLAGTIAQRLIGG